jgi:hypothetical protein
LVSFARYLHEQRSDFIDHRRDDGIQRPGVSRSIEDVDRSDRSAAAVRDRRSRKFQVRERLRLVRPAFTPSYFAPPLPYVEPWERR